MEAVADADTVDTVTVDGTSVRVHPSAATLKKTTHAVAWGGHGAG
jgi:NAD-dependent SIR2 family protein deacetylase